MFLVIELCEKPYFCSAKERIKNLQLGVVTGISRFAMNKFIQISQCVCEL